MPVNKNAMTRYQILDELLSNRYHDYSLDDLTEEVNRRLAEIDPDTNGVVRRTIEGDIRYLEYDSPFMVEIDRYSVSAYNIDKQKSVTKRCLRYADPSFSIFKQELSDDEKYLLREALSLMGQFDGLPNLDHLESLRLGLSVESSVDRRIVSLAKSPLSSSSLFGQLFTAISQQQVVELHYHTFAQPQEQLTTTIHPYLLKEYNRRWFLVAAAEEDGKLLTFALDRIDHCRPLPSHLYVPCSGEVWHHFDEIIGVTLYDDSPLHEIIFWVSNVSRDYVLTKPIHTSQEQLTEEESASLRAAYPTLEAGSYFRIYCKENYELIRELTSFGAELVVLSPEEIQSKASRYVETLSEVYQNLRR